MRGYHAPPHALLPNITHISLPAPAAPQCAVPVTQIVIEPSPLSFGSIVLRSHLSLPQKCCQRWGRPLINAPSPSCGSCSDKDSNVIPSPCPLTHLMSTLQCRESKVRTQVVGTLAILRGLWDLRPESVAISPFLDCPSFCQKQG